MHLKTLIKYYFLVILFFGYEKSWGQSSFAIPLKIAYGINSPINLYQDTVGYASGMIIQSGITYELSIRQKFFVETGIAGRVIFAFGKIKGNCFDARTLRLRIPVKLGYNLSNKWKIASGITLQNNKDFGRTDIREKHFWRCNLLLEGKYNWKKKWLWIAHLNYELRNLPNAYFINDPQLILGLGIARKI